VRLGWVAFAAERAEPRAAELLGRAGVAVSRVREMGLRAKIKEDEISFFRSSF
jgi:hypothetical protein